MLARSTAAVGWIVVCWSALVAIAVPATASPVAPEPTAVVGTLDTPPGAPFDEPVGGARLGIRGRPVVPVGVAPPRSIDAAAWLVADLGSGRVLGGFNPHLRRPPASTIKLLTALAVLPEIDADASYTATDADITVEGSRVGLVPGQRYTRTALLHGLLLGSGNDAANALAQLAGGQARALTLMSDEAKRLGAFDTTVQTTHGLDEPGQGTSAYDLALIGRAVLADKELAAVARTRAYEFPGLDGKTFQIQNRNRLLGIYPGTYGLKNGFTTLSGHSLVAAAKQNGVRLVAVVLGGKGRAEPTAGALLDWGFSLPKQVEPVGRLVTPAEVTAAAQNRDTQTPLAEMRQDVPTVDRTGSEPATSVPTWAWSAGIAGATVAAVAVIAWRSRAHRVRTSGAAARPDRRRARRG
jgi:D-alanyl-D-alanine carboxypeptidase (penicillin-binding protein 5/6)